MKTKQRLNRGVICEKCSKIAYKDNYVRITVLKPIVEDTTGRCVTTSKISLCKECYDKYRELIGCFLHE